MCPLIPYLYSTPAFTHIIHLVIFPVNLFYTNLIINPATNLSKVRGKIIIPPLHNQDSTSNPIKYQPSQDHLKWGKVIFLS